MLMAENERVELCWGCDEPIGGDEAPVVLARPSHARVTGGGWHRWHPWCPPDDYEIYDPAETEEARAVGRTATQQENRP